MKNHRKVLFGLVTASVLALAGTVRADPPGEGGDIWDKITPGAQIRARYEFRGNYDFDRLSPPKDDNDNFALLRTRLHLTAKPDDGVTLFLQFQDSREFGSSLLTGSPYGPGNVPRGVSADDEGTTLHQAWARLDVSGVEGLSVQFGRQEFALGEHRLVGTLDWSNRARSFDGFVVAYEKDKFRADAFGFLVTRGDPAGVITPASAAENGYFTGINGRIKDENFGIAEAYYLNYLDRDAGALRAAPPSIPGDNDLVLHTIGAHLLRAAKRGELDWSLEGAYQWGEDGYLRHRAGAFHVAFGFTADTDIEPRLEFEYNFASGDKNAADNRSRAFRNLFPTNHNKYGLIDFMQWSNLHELNPELSVKVSGVTLAAAYHEFLAVKEEGAIGVGPAALTPLAGRTSRQFGRELDLTATAKPYKPVGVLVGYSMFNPGKMFRQSFPVIKTHAAHFLYLQATVTL